MDFIAIVFSNVKFLIAYFLICKDSNFPVRGHLQPRRCPQRHGDYISEPLWLKEASIQTSFPSAVIPIVTPLPVFKLAAELFTPSSSNLDTRPSRPCALSRTHNIQNLRSWPPRPSLSRYIRNGRSEGTICASLESRLQCARSVEMKINGCSWTGCREKPITQKICSYLVFAYKVEFP